MRTGIYISRPSSRTAVVHLPQTVGTAEVTVIRDAFADLIARERRTDLAVDLSRVETINSAGLACLVAVHAGALAFGGRLTLCAPQDAMYQALAERGMVQRVPTVRALPLLLTRAVRPPYGSALVPAGSFVFRHRGPAFGAVGAGEVPVIFDSAAGAFTGVPRSAVVPVTPGR